MTCSNCTAPALYTIGGDRVSKVYYCGKHLPAFLRIAASRGQIDVVEQSAPTSSKKSAPAPEEPEEVAPVEDGAPAEELEEAPVVEDSEDLEA